MLIPHLRKLIIKAEAPPKKKQKGPAGAEAPPPPKITHCQLFVAERYVGWQEAVLQALQVIRMRMKGGVMRGCVEAKGAEVPLCWVDAAGSKSAVMCWLSC